MLSVPVPIVIFGGGVTGLWLLDRLRTLGIGAILVETNALGQGQTIAAQGILHSGLKYALDGVMSDSGREAREMPARWQQSLAGEVAPNLSALQVLSRSFYLWGTNSLSSRVGMFAARLGLQASLAAIPGNQRPPLLKTAQGVLSVNEMVISTPSLLSTLAAQNQSSLLKVAAHDGIAIDRDSQGQTRIRLRADNNSDTIELLPQRLVLAAGRGNQILRAQLGLAAGQMQTRPLHMVLVRGDLPEFFGHCVEGARTRISITSTRDAQGTIAWQLGGQLAETGVSLDASTLIAQAQAELRLVLPMLDLRKTEWATYRVDRAEGSMPTGQRPSTFRLLQEEQVLTAWPTKLVLAPKLIDAVIDRLQFTADESTALDLGCFADWPRPSVAVPPWDRDQAWQTIITRSNQAA
ncbi:MAG TPA: FAD-dependent oxidoreductase [Pirellulaceae bacterium]|nr:FAD-dependent oxidoreductase [Pirellulaceae bacterium]